MISRPAVIRYDPYTQTMVALDNKDAIHDASRTLMADYHCLQRALTKVSYVTTAWRLPRRHPTPSTNHEDADDAEENVAGQLQADDNQIHSFIPIIYIAPFQEVYSLSQGTA